MVVEANAQAHNVVKLLKHVGMIYVGHVAPNDWFVRPGLLPRVTQLQPLSKHIRSYCDRQVQQKKPQHRDLNGHHYKFCTSGRPLLHEPSCRCNATKGRG